MFQLGRAYYKNNDFSSALVQYRKAADQGYAIAQTNLGLMYERAEAVKKDDAEAVVWYRKAAEQGYLGAQFNLGNMYANGQGVAKDYGQAAEWYRKAADQGYAKAQSSLGVRYYLGQGVPQDYAEAVKWFRKSADQGNADAQINLGLMYARGQSVPQNYAEALKWFRMAADQGNALAQESLGVMYEHGGGVPQDYAEAAKWYRLAASQGDTDAQSNLANLEAHSMPEAESLLLAAVEKARSAYVAGANEMAQGAARPARAKEICAVFKDDLRVSNWLGEVAILSSNSDGLGVLSIQIAEGVSIKTWNNALSDLVDKTLIDPESTVFKQAIALRKGQKIRFGGQFIRNPTDCIREGSLTLKGSLTQPEFIFRFSNLTAFE
jgi:TPR repeat protein